MMKNAHKITILFIILILITVSNTYAADDNQTITTTDITNNPENPIEEPSPTTEIEHKTINITQDNYKNYTDYEFEDNTQIIINENISDLKLIITGKNVTLTSTNNATLINSAILVGYGNIIAFNINFETNDNSQHTENIVLESDNNILENITFTEYRNKITYDNYRAVTINGNNNTIKNCVFNLSYPSMRINWDRYDKEGRAEAIIAYGDYNQIVNNTFNINESENKEYPYGTIYTMSIYGNNNSVDHNNITMNGTLYLYGIHIFKNNNTVTNNYIKISSIRYANGISISFDARDNLLRNNTIILSTSNATLDQTNLIDAAYGIILTDYEYHGSNYDTSESKINRNRLEENDVFVNSTHAYGIETFGGEKTVMTNNTVNVVGLSAIGIAAVGKDMQINGNYIQVKGQTNQTQDSPDYLKPQTSGIYLFYGRNNEIVGNIINSTTGAAIKTENEYLTTITYNNLTVVDNDVVINILNGRGRSLINYNGIYDILNHVINGIEGSDNYELDPDLIKEVELINETSNIPENQTDTNEEPENSTIEDETSLNDTIPDIIDENVDINDTNLEENNTEIDSNSTSEENNITEEIPVEPERAPEEVEEVEPTIEDEKQEQVPEEKELEEEIQEDEIPEQEIIQEELEPTHDDKEDETEQSLEHEEPETILTPEPIVTPEEAITPETAPNTQTIEQEIEETPTPEILEEEIIPEQSITIDIELPIEESLPPKEEIVKEDTVPAPNSTITETEQSVIIEEEPELEEIIPNEEEYLNEEVEVPEEKTEEPLLEQVITIEEPILEIVDENENITLENVELENKTGQVITSTIIPRPATVNTTSVQIYNLTNTLNDEIKSNDNNTRSPEPVKRYEISEDHDIEDSDEEENTDNTEDIDDTNEQDHSILELNPSVEQPSTVHITAALNSPKGKIFEIETLENFVNENSNYFELILLLGFVFFIYGFVRDRI